MAGAMEAIEAMGLPIWALVPLAIMGLIASLFVLDALSFTVLKPSKSPPIIGTLPVVGGMMQFIKVGGAAAQHAPRAAG